MKNNIIYGLYCPFLNTLHYIGKSTYGMTRPLQHLTGSHSEKINEWVNQLKLLGNKPIVKVLEECNDDDIDERERFWIKKSINENCYLFNIAHNVTNKITTQKEYQINDVDILIIGKTIKEARKKNGLNSIELSKLSGIDRSTLYYIERGDKQITLRNLKKVLNVLGYEIQINKIK